MKEKKAPKSEDKGKTEEKASGSNESKEKSSKKEEKTKTKGKHTQLLALEDGPVDGNSKKAKRSSPAEVSTTASSEAGSDVKKQKVDKPEPEKRGNQGSTGESPEKKKAKRNLSSSSDVSEAPGCCWVYIFVLCMMVFKS